MKNQIEANNELIAIFMGMKPHENDYGVMIFDHTEFRGNDMCNVSDLEYHKDWNELHKVIDEIEKVCEGVPQQLIHLSLFSERTEVYDAVVEFMRIYNPLKKL
jgi:hypothetical protein